VSVWRGGACGKGEGKLGVAPPPHSLTRALPTHPRSFRPRVAAITALALAALFDPSAAAPLARLPLSTALLLTCPDVVRAMRGNFMWWVGLHAFAAGVSPGMKALWLGGNAAGNANFMFNQHLLFAFAAGTLLAEFAAAALRVERQRKAAAAAAAGGKGGAEGAS
jgi:hypothetical protein